MKKKNMIISLTFVLLFNLLLWPGYDRYVGLFFTVVAVVLNLYTSIVLAVILRLWLNKAFPREDFGMYLGLMCISAVAHGIFTVMFYSAWICLALSLLTILFLILNRNKMIP